nr:integrase, catalytic region, zinc finger, CCHC-type, peptidase aspartic, catalytic [Tanacetum cinerariifolium]
MKDHITWGHLEKPLLRAQKEHLSTGRFVTAVKLNRGLRDSNYDQLYAYLKQHEIHAQENKMMLERFSQPMVDPLALMSNVSNPQHYSPSSSALSLKQAPPPLADSSLSPAESQGMNLRGGSTAGYGGAQNRVGNVNQGQARPGQARPADDCDAFDSDVDEAPTAQTMFMANLSFADPVTDEVGPLYDSDILSEVQDHDHYLDAVCAHHEEHVMQDNVQLDHVVDSHADYTSDSNMIPYDQYVKDNKVKIVPRDYSKENFLATFTPQKQLTPEQIFWSNDLMKLKSKALKERTKVSRPIKALTVYPPNIPATLVPKVLPIKSQLKIHIFTLIQFFSEFDKTCKKSITPTGLTEGEMGFEQTKECYLKEVIPFFRTLKDNFKGIQKALTKEIKEMKDVFKELEAEVAQYAVDRKNDAIERKNLLIANDNLIAESLSQEVFYVATNSELNVARFTKMHVANTTVEARCLAFEAELANLRNNNNHDNQKELINHFSKLEVNHLNLQLKYQNLKDSIGNNPPTPDKDTPDFDSVFVIGKMQAFLQGKDNVIRQLKKQISQLQVTRSDTDRTLKHYKELYDSIKIIRAKHIEHVTHLTTENVNLKASVSKDRVKPQVLAREKHFIDVEPIVPRLRNNRDAHLDYLRHLKESVETIRDIVKEAKVLANIPLIRKKQVTVAKPSDKSDGVNSCSNASRSQPNSTTKTHRISPANSVNKLPVEDQPRTNKSHPRTSNRVDFSSRLKRAIIHSNSDSICKTCNKCLTSSNRDICCSKHITRDRSRLMNFVKKFIGTVRFGNNHFGAIMGYEDYVIGDNVISRVYYVEGLGHNLFSVGQFCDSDMEVAFKKHSCYVRDTNGVELIKGSRGSNLYTISVEDVMKSSPISCQLGKSKKHTHKPKTKKTNLEVLNTLHMDLCGPMRVQTINGKKYILVIVDDYSQFTWVKFLRSKDETPEVIIKFITQIQVGLNKTVRYVLTDNGTEFVNHTLIDYYKRISIFHQKTMPRTLQQNGVVKRRNRTLVEAARTMLIFPKPPMFMWAEAVATACYTQNRSLIHTRHYKTPYELVHNKKPDLTFFRVFGALCYPTNDNEDLGKL